MMELFSLCRWRRMLRGGMLAALLWCCPAAWAQGTDRLVLPGDYPDPSVLRDGDDYYMTHSSFNYLPGLLVWHSTDLRHWEPVGHALAEYHGPVWAPDLVKHGDTYYIYYPAGGTNWVVWAKDIKGPWSRPVDLKLEGIDPGHVVDGEGNRYLYVDNGCVVRLSPDGLSTVGGKRKVYDGWAYPSDWQTECFCLEAPKLMRHGEYYYLTSAQGGTAGPATSHMVVSARSKDVCGPWENSPCNPVVHTRSDREPWWSKGHGTLAEGPGGRWWMFYHGYAKGFHTLGRSTLMTAVEWTDDGWFRVDEDADVPETSFDLPLSDEFEDGTLGMQWAFWEEYAPQALRFADGMLWMDAKGTGAADGRLLLVNPGDRSYEVQAEVHPGSGNAAGLLLFYDGGAWAGVVYDGRAWRVYSGAKEVRKLECTLVRKFHARIRNVENRVDIAVSRDGQDWMTLAEGMDVSALNHNRCGGFLSLRAGLLSAGDGQAGFGYFRYRPL